MRPWPRTDLWNAQEGIGSHPLHLRICGGKVEDEGVEHLRLRQSYLSLCGRYLCGFLQTRS